MATMCDVLVIGGGPAGSTAAATLAGRRRDVVIVEKERHPRFHIGESLLPLNTAIFDRLGITDAVASVGQHKPGAEFVSDATGRAVQFSFAQGLDQRYTSSWQVPRAALDDILFRTARDRGAKAFEATRVTAVTPGRSGERARVEAVGLGGEALVFAPRFVLDASGRDTFLAGRLRTKRANKQNRTAAVYAHFRGAERRTGELDGYISVHLVDDGWFWLIPLPDDVMSVGFVGDASAFKGRSGTPSEMLEQRIARSPTVARRMQGATRIGDVTSTGNYSYFCDRAFGDGYMMVGDAFAFLDPVFSSGVLLAMTSGEMGADVAEASLDDPARGMRKAAAAETEIRHAMQRLAWLVYRIDRPALRLLFMTPSNRLRMRDGLVSLLAGNLRSRPDQRVPVLAFKGAYYVASALLRLGLIKDPARA
ncbi:MAG: NAD(P)/FAD-dependent oxidoreductase [Acetobacteraceae bacterium]|nr:NAD(P)/FAD-dependent oxidoreductase [Acetobacteraceae bacterium]